MLPITCSFILFIVALFHFYWGFGGHLGYNVSIPQHPNGRRVFNPRSGSAHLVGVLLIGCALSILVVGSYVALPVPRNLPRAVLALFSVIFTIRALGWFHYVGFFKKVRSTSFALYDTWLFCPLCLFLGISLGNILLNT